jgi:hypothetical protein
MKVFFNASLTGKREYGKNYQAIYDAIKSSNCQIVAAPVFEGNPDKVAEETVNQAETYYQKLTKWMRSADLTFFEVSYPSTGVGHEVAMALMNSKPVIALHVEDKIPYVLDSIPNDKLQVIEYRMDNVTDIIKEAIKYAEDMVDTRFNFFVSPKIVSYLDWVSKEKRLPRAVYLRKLIEDEMKKDKEFQGEL